MQKKNILKKIYLQIKKLYSKVNLILVKRQNPYFLDFPVEKIQNDYIGFDAQTDALYQSIKNGAKMIGIIADYGSGKSSLVSLLKRKLRFKRYKIIKVNLWHINKETNQNNSEKAVQEIHKKFLFQLTSQLKKHSLVHFTRKMNSNYSNASISVKNRFSYVLFFFSVSLFVINYLNKMDLLHYINFLPYINAQWLMPYFKDIANFSGVLALIFIVISMISSDIVFSFLKATPDKERNISENDTLEAYLDIVKPKLFSKRKIIVIEDLDRVTKEENIKLFLEQIYTFYAHSDDTKVVFIIALKSQDYFDKIEEHYKIFDYTVDLKKLKYSDLRNVFLELLKSKEKIVKAKYNIDFSDNNVGDWLWLVQGKELNIRQLKHRYNETLLNYVTLTNRFSDKKSISIKSCIAFSYLKNEYPKLYCTLIEEDVFADEENFSDLKKLINSYIEHKQNNKDDLWQAVSNNYVVDSTNNSDIIERFKQDVFDLIRNEYINDNFEMYTYNFPKTNTIFTLAEDTFHQSYLYNKKPINLDEIVNEISNSNKGFIQSTVQRGKELNKSYPDFIFDNEQLFENIYTNANEDDREYIFSNMLKINPQTSKKTFDRLNVIKNYQVVDNNFIMNYFSAIKDNFREDNEDDTIYNLRYELLTIFNTYKDLFKKLYSDEFPNPSQKEYDLIKDFSLAMEYLNYDRLDKHSIDNISCFINNHYSKVHFNELMIFMEKLDKNQFHQLLSNLRIYDKFTDDNKEKIITTFEDFLNLDNWENLVGIIKTLNYINPYLEEKLINQVEENLISKEEYCNFINKVDKITDATIKFISNSNFDYDYGFNEIIQEKMYSDAYYLAYVKTKTLYNKNFIFEQNKLANLEESYINLYCDVNLYHKYYSYIISCKQLLDFYKSRKIYLNCSEDYLTPFSFIEQDYELFNYMLNEIDEIKILDAYILNLKTANLSINEWNAIIDQYVNKLVQISDEAHTHFKSLLPGRNLKLKIHSFRCFRRRNNSQSD